MASNEVRIPRPSRGVAMRVTRYREDHSVILHPDDFQELQLLEALVEDAGRLEPLEITQIGEQAHLDEDRAGSSVEDPAVLQRLFAS